MGEESTKGVSRVIDFRVPLPWLAGAAVSLAAFMFNLHADVRQLLRDSNKTQSVVESTDSKLSTITAEIALLKLRMDTVENGLKVLQGSRAAKEP
ncbi:MAG: hypothetical protein Q4F13_02800 [Pseudomonadota bacterium]|nr:hypothetical protein [Pseudomonadota bacterium]